MKATNKARITSAAVTAAPKKADHVTAIKTLAADYTSKATNAVGALQLEYALKARVIIKQDPDAVIKPLADAFGKQRKAELMRVVDCDNDEMLIEAQKLAKGRTKAGLQQTARVLQMQYYNAAGGKIDLKSAAARKYITSGAKKDFLIACGKSADEAQDLVNHENAAKKQARGVKASKAHASAPVQAVAKSDDKDAHNEGNAWIELERALTKLEKAYKDKPAVAAGCTTIRAIISSLVDLTAE